MTSRGILGMVLLGLMGAGAGYMLLAEKVGRPKASALGAALAVLPVLALRPGGWLRPQPAVSGRVILR